VLGLLISLSSIFGNYYLLNPSKLHKGERSVPSFSLASVPLLDVAARSGRTARKTTTSMASELHNPLTTPAPPLLPRQQPAPARSRCPRWRAAHPNIRRICLFSFLFHLGWSIWERNVFPPFLTLIGGGSKELVGWVQTAQGVTALVAAPLFGMAMDLSSSSAGGGTRPMKWVAAAVGFCAVTCVVYAIYMESTGWTMYAATSAWGLLLSAQGVLVETTLANSVRRGKERTWAYVTKATWWRLGNAVAQGMNLAAFYMTGNTWEVGTLKVVMYVGLGVLVPPLLILLTLQSVGGEEEGEGVEGLVVVEKDGHTAAAAAALRTDSSAASRPPRLPFCLRCCRPKWVITFAVLLRVIGKGVVMRYGPITRCLELGYYEGCSSTIDYMADLQYLYPWLL
jgi:hypothetical protein